MVAGGALVLHRFLRGIGDRSERCRHGVHVERSALRRSHAIAFRNGARGARVVCFRGSCATAAAVSRAFSDGLRSADRWRALAADEAVCEAVKGHV